MAIEGPIGAGKTSLARRLADHLGGRLLLEAPEANPYLEGFYAGAPGLALQTQLAFLHHRADQVRVLGERGGPVRVSDFLFDKDALFAQLTLAPEELAVYRAEHRRIAQALARELPPPDLVIWLRAPVSTLQARIRQRGIPMEQGIADAYLLALSDAYERHFASYDIAPVLAVDAAHDPIDAGTPPGAFERLLQRMASLPQPPSQPAANSK